MRNLGIVCGPKNIENLFLSREVSLHKEVNCNQIDHLILLDSSRDIAHKRYESSRGASFFLLSYQEGEFFEEIQSYRELILSSGLVVVLYCLAVKNIKEEWLIKSLWRKEEIDIFLNSLPDFLKWVFLLKNKPSKN